MNPADRRTPRSSTSTRSRGAAAAPTEQRRAPAQEPARSQPVNRLDGPRTPPAGVPVAPTAAPAAAPRSSAAPAVPRSRDRDAGGDRDAERTSGGRRGRRVTRVIRRIELWSVLKLSIVLLFCLYLAVLLALVAIWNIAYGTGQIERLQSFLSDVGLHDWRFYGDRMFRAAMAIGAVGVLAGSILSVLVAGLVNVVSEITGGIRFSVIEEEPRRRR